MFKKSKLLLPLILITAFVLSGCISLQKKQAAPPPIPPDGGFYVLGKNKEGDYMWTQKVYLATSSSQKPNFKLMDITVMTKDPQDDNAIYLGTKKNGMYYTYDAGNNWFSPEKFQKKEINAIEISHKNKCLIYIATGPELYKSEDCSRTWTRIYNDTRPDFYITALAVDSYNEGTIYMGLGINTKSKDKREGEVTKSIDFGKSWQPPSQQLRVPSGTIISKLLINPKDTRIVYAATNNKGIFKTIDGGNTWDDITGEAQKVVKGEEFIQRFEKLIDFTTNIKAKVRESLVFRDMVFIPDEDDSLIHASNYGLLRSNDGGRTWSEIDLIPPEGETKAIIYSLAVHPENGKEFYYGTDSTLFKTVDGGNNWTTIKGPGTRAIYKLLVTANESGESNVYAGMYNLKPPAKK
jgi:photosystem II stability/assembly factor-like uncharacterized protein